MEDILSLGSESNSAIGHHALSLRSANGATKVGLSRLAEFAVLAFYSNGG